VFIATAFYLFFKYLSYKTAVPLFKIQSIIDATTLDDLNEGNPISQVLYKCPKFT
jgi:hypothetical protein